MSTSVPLAERMRPKTLEDYIGQEEVVGEGSPLRKVLKSGFIPSMILWGPPGVGKTTLAHLISKTTGRSFHELSAINSGVKEVREVIQRAEKTGLFNQGKSAILFIDEIHRFSKSQQDSLLGAVERGVITLIGATTENPSFEVISALLSRSQVYTLRSLTKEHLKKMLDKALKQDQWLAAKKLKMKEYDALIAYSGGDGRRLYNLLEMVGNDLEEGANITDDEVSKIVKAQPNAYDKSGEMHYDIISAFIKSIRGSDPNAAVYYLARMIAGGEDPKFIARRLLILASEDIGMANPNALMLATETFKAVEVIGWPESRIILSQCCIYLASSPKSNASYMAINKAQETVKETGDLNIPLAIRNAPTELMKDLNYGKGYKYAHDHPGNFANMEFLPDEIKGSSFYNPGNNPKENKLRDYLKNLWKEKYNF